MQKQLTVKCECGSEAKQPKHISQADYDTHDCHLSAEDGCQVCVEWAEQRQEEQRAVDAAMLKFQLGNL